jgi:hypothetical protein
MNPGDLVNVLGRTLGLSLAAGINLYATVAILGLVTHFGWVDLPAQYRIFDNPWIIGAALILYVVEFVADKIPWVDSLWDAVHTVIRPIGGALIAVQSAIRSLCFKRWPQLPGRSSQPAHTPPRLARVPLRIRAPNRFRTGRSAWRKMDS